MALAPASTRHLAAGRRPALLLWLRWLVTFLAFPLGGLAGLAAGGGRVDGVVAALAGGAVTGLVLGVAQALAARRLLPFVAWTVATGAGLGIGLAAGAAAVGFGTTLGDVALAGAVTGLVLGAAQAAVLPAVPAARRALWALATCALWSLGWTVTTLAGVDVDRQFTVFGATGALVFSALSGLVLLAVLPRAEDAWVRS